jgi:broad specificity phosphatase PhoE
MKKIILLRHGEVDIRNCENITAKQFLNWISVYNNSDIKSEFSSKEVIRNLLNTSEIIVCSKLHRSIQSIEIFDKRPFEINDIFNEAELPSLNWNIIKLRPKIWLIIFRTLWLLGYSKNCESYKNAKQRAKQASEILIALSSSEQSVILVGHGIMNSLIKKELILNKWYESKKNKNKNWDYGIVEIHISKKAKK